MRRLVLALAAPILLFSSPATTAGLPLEVQTAIDESVSTCEPGKATMGKSFVSRKDINGDGIEDFILNYGAFECDGNASFFCGSAGCTIQVFASKQGLYKKIIDENVQDVSFKLLGGRSLMVLELHGSACGKSGSAPCRKSYFWDGQKFAPGR